MILRGATKTLTEKHMQIHPRTCTRWEPRVRNVVSTRIRPNTPMFTDRTSFAVKICAQAICMRIITSINRAETDPHGDASIDRFYFYLHGLGRVRKEEQKVRSLDDAASRVDGDQEVGVRLVQRVEDPQRGAEESHHVRQAREPLRRFLPAHSAERRPALFHRTGVED